MVADQEEEEVGKEEAALVIVLQEDLLKCIRRFAINADKIVKCLLGLHQASQFIVKIVLKATEDLIQGTKEEVLTDLLILRAGRCLRQFVMSVETTVKCLFSQAAESRFTAVIVSEIKKKAEIGVEDLPSLNIQNSLSS